MPDNKSQLEREIERRELTKKPVSVLILIAFLSICLGALGVYTFKLKQELSIKENEIVLIKRNFNDEKSDLLNTIKKLESELPCGPDQSNTPHETKAQQEKIKETP